MRKPIDMFEETAPDLEADWAGLTPEAPRSIAAARATQAPPARDLGSSDAVATLESSLVTGPDPGFVVVHA